MADVILETARLALRELEEEDFSALCAILQDPLVMYAYEHAFSGAEVRDWLEGQRRRYRDDGMGLWAAVQKETGKLIGQCGLTMQKWEETRVAEIGYLFRRDCWHQGYAVEAAAACREYAFHTLGLREVFSIIRVENLASRRVAERNGMTVCGRLVKEYYGMVMPHLVYWVKG